jgi:hypothetical protein
MGSTGKRLTLGVEGDMLGWFVGEPFPSRSTGTSMRTGTLTAQPIRITSRMNDGGIVFADGIEQDHLDFGWGQRLEPFVAQQRSAC